MPTHCPECRTLIEPLWDEFNDEWYCVCCGATIDPENIDDADPSPL